MPPRNRPERAAMMKPVHIHKGMADVAIYHVVNREDWLHFAVIWREAGKKYRKAFPTFEEAKAAATQIAESLADGHHLLVSVPRGELARYKTLEKMLGPNQSLEDLVKEHAEFNPADQDQSTPKIVDQYFTKHPEHKKVLCIFAEYFRCNHLVTILPQDINRFIEAHWTGNKDQTEALQAVEALFQWAAAHKILPPGEIPSTKPDEPIMKPEELKTLLENTPDEAKPLVALNAYTGRSMEDLGLLRWEDIDWAQKTIDTSLFRETEPIYLTPEITKFLKKYKRTRGLINFSQIPLKTIAKQSKVIWKPKLLSRSCRIYERLLQDPNTPSISGIDPKDAEAWFKVFKDLV